MKVLLIVLGALMAASGLYCMFTPAITYATLGFIIGAAMIIDGVGKICAWNQTRKIYQADKWALISGIVSLAFGILLVASDAMQLAVDMVIVYIAAFWVLVIGFIRIAAALSRHRLSVELGDPVIGVNWGFSLFLGVLLVLLGILCFANPMILAVAMGILMGLAIFIAGLNLMTIAWMF